MDQNPDLEALPIDPHIHDDTPGRDRVPSTDARPPGQQNILTQRESRSDEPLPGAQQTNTDRLPAGGGVHTGGRSQRPEDFDDSANALWSLYEKEAKSHDEATVGTIKDDMDGVLIFAGLFSAALTAFIIDRCQNIQQNPAQQSVHYQKKSAELLNQISYQLSSLGAQFPSNLSLPEPTLSPSRSDVRVNIYWFISLVSSLSAALLATLIQRWARDHMHVFRRYGHPLKIARIRQFLHEGVERWHVLAIAEGVPGLIHISLFLFFIGLSDFLWNTYAIVGKITAAPVVLIAVLYIFSTGISVRNPQSPYRTSFTGFAWFITRKLRTRLFKDRSGIETPLSSNMAEGQMQLAMEKNVERKGRDERAIRWLVNNLTEDIEMESLASGIPGSFDANWGVEVWKNGPQCPDRRSALSNFFPRHISNFFSLTWLRNSRSSPNNPATSAQTDPDPDLDTVPPTPSHLPVCGEVVYELCQRIQRLFETCNHRRSFVNQDEWRRRSRACIESAASFVFCMDAKISWFGDIGKLLNDLGTAERTREVSASSLNRTFTTRWTCFSLVAIRKMLHSPQLGRYVKGTMQTLGTLPLGNDFTPLETARRIDEQFAAAWDCVERLRQAFNALGEGNNNVERVEEVLSRYRPRLEDIQLEADSMKQVDRCISDIQKQIDQATHGLTRQLPGVAFDDLRTDHAGPTPINQVFDYIGNPVRPQLSYLSQRLLGLCSLSHPRSSRGYLGVPEVLRGVENIPPSLRSVPRHHHLMERQLWRLEDLGCGGAFGFTLELYFLSLRQILSTFTSSPKDIDISFYTRAFKVITSDWEQVKGIRGTLQIILNLVCDIAIRDRGNFSNYRYPGYITKELLELLGNMVRGQAKPCIDAARAELRSAEWRIDDRDFLEGVLGTFQPEEPPAPDSP